MTNNFHTPIATNSPLNAAVLEAPLSALDSAITNIRAGTTSLTGLNLGAAGALIISGDAVTRTGPRHTIDTQAAATTDDLTTINGGATGDILIISVANASRVVTVKHGTGNIYLASKLDKILDDTDKQIMLVYNGSRWEETNGLHTTTLTNPTAAPYRVPTNMPLLHHPMARNGWGFKAAAATVQATGIAAPTASGTPTASNQTDSTYINLASGAVGGNSAGYVTATYNLVRRQYNPKLSLLMQVVDTTNCRLLFGFSSAALTTADTVAGATEAAIFRLSSVAGDLGFVPITKDATTQTTGSAMNTVAVSTRYLLQIELTSSSAIFTINNGTPTVITTNLPVTTTELGVNVLIFTTVATAKNWLFSRLWVDYD